MNKNQAVSIYPKITRKTETMTFIIKTIYFAHVRQTRNKLYSLETLRIDAKQFRNKAMLGIYILGHFKRLKLKNFPSRPTMVTDILKYLLDPRIFFISTGLLRLVRLVTVRILLGDFVSGATYSSLS